MESGESECLRRQIENAVTVVVCIQRVCVAAYSQLFVTVATIQDEFSLNCQDASMPHSSSDSETSYDSEDSEMCYNIEMEDDGHDLCVSLSSPRSLSASSDEDIAAVADDPVADSEWTENYERR